MAKYQTPPLKITALSREGVQSLINTLEQELPRKFFNDGIDKNLTDPVISFDGQYYWSTGQEFLNYISTITGTSDVIAADSVLYKVLASAPETSTMTGAPEYAAPSNTLTPDQLEILQEEAELAEATKTATRKDAEKKEQENIDRLEKAKAEAESKKTIYDAKNKQVQEAIIEKQKAFAEEIAKAKQIQTELQAGTGKIYVKVVEPKKEPDQQLESLRKQATADPKRFIHDATEIYKRKIAAQNLTSQESDLVAKQAAYTTYETFTDSSPLTQAAIIYNVIESKEVLDKISPNPEIQARIKDYGNSMIHAKTAQFELYRQFIDTQKMPGVANLDEIQVLISDSPQPGYTEFNLNTEVIEPQVESLNNQNSSILEMGSIPDFSVDTLKSKILLKAGESLSQKVAALPADSVLAQAYNSEVVQLGLSSMGFVAPSSWIAVEGSWVGNFVVSSGYGPLAGFVQTTTGIDFGIINASTLADVGGVSGGSSLVGSETALEIGGTLAGAGVGTGIAAAAAESAATYTSIAATGGAMAAEAFAGGAGGALASLSSSTAVGAAAGSAVPGPGTIIGAVVGFIGGLVGPQAVNWVKDRISDSGKFIVGGIGMLVGGVYGGTLGGGVLLGMTLGGLGGYGGATLLSGGLPAVQASASGLFTGIANSLGIAFEVALAGISAPLITIFIGFPIVIALILVIINNSAYVVPPSLTADQQGYDNPYISVTKIASPDKISNPTTKTTVTYTVTVTAIKGLLTNLHITNSTCSVTKKNKSSVKCPIEFLPVIPSDATADTGSPYSFTFSADFNSTLSDSIVFDSIEVTADSLEEKNVSSIGSETVCVGECPSSCVKVVDNADVWPSNIRTITENAALSIQGDYPKFMQMVCSDGEVNLCFKPRVVDGGGWHVHNTYKDNCDVYFKGGVLTNDGNALFMLAHELTHHIQSISGALSQYEQSGAPRELPICSYPKNGYEKTTTEGMAEANGLYVSIPTWAGCVGNFKSKYPLNYNFANGFMK